MFTSNQLMICVCLTQRRGVSRRVAFFKQSSNVTLLELLMFLESVWNKKGVWTNLTFLNDWKTASGLNQSVVVFWSDWWSLLPCIMSQPTLWRQSCSGDDVKIVKMLSDGAVRSGDCLWWTGDWLPVITHLTQLWGASVSVNQSEAREAGLGQ